MSDPARVRAAVSHLLDVAEGLYGPAPDWATGPLAGARILVIAGAVARDFGISAEELAAGCAEFITAKLDGEPKRTRRKRRGGGES